MVRYHCCKSQRCFIRCVVFVYGSLVCLRCLVYDVVRDDWPQGHARVTPGSRQGYARARVTLELRGLRQGYARVTLGLRSGYARNYARVTPEITPGYGRRHRWLLFGSSMRL